jgi:hypothetical protein
VKNLSLKAPITIPCIVLKQAASNTQFAAEFTKSSKRALKYSLDTEIILID